MTVKFATFDVTTYYDNPDDLGAEQVEALKRVADSLSDYLRSYMGDHAVQRKAVRLAAHELAESISKLPLHCGA